MDLTPQQTQVQGVNGTIGIGCKWDHGFDPTTYSSTGCKWNHGFDPTIDTSTGCKWDHHHHCTSIDLVTQGYYTTRGNSIKLSPLTTPHHNYRANFFSVRIIPIWNSLPDTVVKSSSERTFRLMLNNVDLSIFVNATHFRGSIQVHI